MGLSPHGVDAAVPATGFNADKSVRRTYYGSGDAALELAVDAAAGEIDLASVVTHVDSLDGVESALGRLRRGGGARTVLIVDAGLAGREV